MENIIAIGIGVILIYGIILLHIHLIVKSIKSHIASTVEEQKNKDYSTRHQLDILRFFTLLNLYSSTHILYSGAISEERYEDAANLKRELDVLSEKITDDKCKLKNKELIKILEDL